MDQALLESIKGKSREERKAFFLAHKEELLDNDLLNVNGGEAEGWYKNPDSDVPDYYGRWWTSWGFICKGGGWDVNC